MTIDLTEKNPAVIFANKNKLNPFTERIKNICEQHGYCFVSLVNNEIIKVFLIIAEQDDEFAGEKKGDITGFKSQDYNRAWYANGTSLISERYDIYSII